MIKDRVGKDINIGDFVIFVTKTESPSLRFGWINDIVQDVAESTATQFSKQRWVGTVKITNAEADGTVINKVRSVYNFDDQKYDYEDTGKPDISRLQVYVDNTWTMMRDNRFLVTKPF